MADAALYFWLGGAAVLAFIDLVVIMNLWQSEKRASTKLGWALLIVALPIIGLIIWGFAGPRGMPKPPSSPEQSK